MEAGQIGSDEARMELVTPQEAGKRIGRKGKTIRNWACAGQIGEAEGVCHVRGRLMIDWKRFEAAMVTRG